MNRIMMLSAITVILCAFLAPSAYAEDIAPHYLTGKWIINASACSDPDGEYYEFYEDGTFKSRRNRQLEIIGFWQIVEGVLYIQMLTSPAYFKDIREQLSEYDGIYQHFEGKMVLFNAQPERFDTVGVLGNQLTKAFAARCQ